MIAVRTQTEAFDAAAEQARLVAGRADIGAVVSFTGLVRDMSDNGPIAAMTLEHYAAMVEKEMARVAAEASRRWPLLGGTVIHRHGLLKPGDPIVLVVIAAAHRADAFEAAWFLMDWLKTKAPFWKREESATGANWVEAKGEDAVAARRWDKE